MMPKLTKYVCCIFFGAYLISCQARVTENSEKKAINRAPNIVLIMADDMGYSDIGCFGSEIPTPHIDSLANKSLVFTNFYNASRCCPSRASLLTGVYPHQAGMGEMTKNWGIEAYQGFIRHDVPTIAEILQAEGYSTLMSGKWHLGKQPENLPLKRGFDRFFGLVTGTANHFNTYNYRSDSLEKPVIWLEDSLPYHNGDFYSSDLFTAKALNFIQERKKDDPFFLYLAYTAPHFPLHAKPEDIAKFEGKYDKGWDFIREERLQRMKKLGILDIEVQLSQRYEEIPEWSTLSDAERELWSRRMETYAAMVHSMDQNIGKLINFLKSSGELENTLIVFLSDNGGSHEAVYEWEEMLTKDVPVGYPGSFEGVGPHWANVSNTPFRMFKHWQEEGGIRTPLIVYNPYSAKNMKIDQPFHIIDLFPTLAQLAGSEKYQGPGISLKPVLQGQIDKQPVHEFLFWEHRGHRAVRKGDWKLVAQNTEEWRLYNLKQDPVETIDLINDHPEQVRMLKSAYFDWAHKAGVVNYDSLRKAHGRLY